MDKIKIYPVPAKWKVNAKTGKCPIHLCIDLNRKRAAFPSLGISVNEYKDWDNERREYKKHVPNSAQLNKKIYNKIADIELSLLKIENTGTRITKQIIRDCIGGNVNSNVISFFAEYIEFIKSDRKSKNAENKKFSDNNIRKWEAEYNRLKTYVGQNLSFNDITVKWLEKYETKCAAYLDKDTSLPITISRLLQLFRKAEAKGLFNMKTISGYKKPTYRNPERPYLTLDQTDKIGELIYSGKLDAQEALKTVACYFLIECYSGLRFVDWGRFTVEKLITRSSIKVRAKKNGEPVYVPFDNSPRLARIVKYIKDNKLSFDYTEAFTNRSLKIISVMAGVPVNITTHLGRHTFATLMLEIGYSKETVAEFMGISLKTVDIYAKNTRRKITLEYDKLGGL